MAQQIEIEREGATMAKQMEMEKIKPVVAQYAMDYKD
jgi:hypothetical protein